MAVRFYCHSNCFGSAIRLAKEAHLDGELMGMALKSSNRDMLEVAKYFEGNLQTIDRAILLYQKVGL